MTSIRTFVYTRVALFAVVMAVAAFLLTSGTGSTPSGDQSLASNSSASSTMQVVASAEGGAAESVEIQPINAFTDYWTCVGAVGGQIANYILTKQLWRVPPWVWPQVRAACWRFIWS